MTDSLEAQVPLLVWVISDLCWVGISPSGIPRLTLCAARESDAGLLDFGCEVKLDALPAFFPSGDRSGVLRACMSPNAAQLEERVKRNLKAVGLLTDADFEEVSHAVW